MPKKNITKRKIEDTAYRDVTDLDIAMNRAKDRVSINQVRPSNADPKTMQTRKKTTTKRGKKVSRRRKVR